VNTLRNIGIIHCFSYADLNAFPCTDVENNSLLEFYLTILIEFRIMYVEICSWNNHNITRTMFTFCKNLFQSKFSVYFCVQYFLCIKIPLDGQWKTRLIFSCIREILANFHTSFTVTSSRIFAVQ